MQPLRRIIDDAPEFISIPEEMQHRRIELIIWPLPDEQAAPVIESAPTPAESAEQPQPSFYDLTKEFCGCIDSVWPETHWVGWGKLANPNKIPTAAMCWSSFLTPTYEGLGFSVRH